MIIWSRWGIVVLLFLGLGLGLGWALGWSIWLLQPSEPVNGILFMGIGDILSAALLWLFVKYVVGTYIDKPRAAVMYEKLAEPIRNENNSIQTHRVIPILHPETGQQIYTNPVSSFFFIPLRFWPFLLGGIGVVVLVVGVVTGLTRG